MRINRIDINPSLVIPEACRGSCMVKKELKSSKTYVNMRSIEPKNSEKMGTNKTSNTPSHSLGIVSPFYVDLHIISADFEQPTSYLSKFSKFIDFLQSVSTIF